MEKVLFNDVPCAPVAMSASGILDFILSSSDALDNFYKINFGSLQRYFSECVLDDIKLEDEFNDMLVEAFLNFRKYLIDWLCSRDYVRLEFRG